MELNLPERSLDMIKASGITKYYGNLCAVNNVSFTIEKGHIYGLLGLNGAGKSTTLGMITGTLPMSSGTVSFDGIDLCNEPLKYKKHIGYLPENPPLYPELTVREYLCFVADAKGISKKELSSELARVMGETDISSVQNRLIKTLSKGFCQRVGVAAAMLSEPDVIILDEPTVGLDPRQVVALRELIKRLAKNRTVILSSHILSEIEEMCDMIMIISQGSLVACDSLEALQNRYASQSVLTMRARTSCKRAVEILKDFTALGELKIEDSNKKGCSITLTCPKKNDPREKIFFAFANSGVPILEMNYHTPTLEDVFLKATTANIDSPDEADDNLQDSEEYIPLSKLKKESKKEALQESGEDDDGDGDDYKPLFG